MSVKWLHAARMTTVVAAAGAMLAGAPAAFSQPPGEGCPQQDAPPQGAEQQRCEQQTPGMPDLPDLPQNQNGAREGNLADTNCWVVNGVPRWNAPGTAPAPAGPLDDVQWCPTFYGLAPQPSGT